MTSVEKFAALTGLPGIAHGFTLRVAGLDVRTAREAALALLESHHRGVQDDLGLGGKRLVIGEQLHGREVAVVDGTTPTPVPGVDGVITNDPSVCLGVYVADCCAVYLVDPVRRAIGLLHSGRKGSELGITTAAVERMRDAFGCNPADLVVQLGPCIRPPHYEIDFAALIVAQARAAGVRAIHDIATCTASHPERYYSYRAERGKTGRMLALLSLQA